MNTQQDPKAIEKKSGMQFKEGADVYTSDGDKVGDIDRVVLDPTTKEITHLVVRQGFIFTEDKVVPMALVDSATEERLVLKEVDDLDNLPDFEETFYVRVDETETGTVPETPGAPKTRATPRTGAAPETQAEPKARPLYVGGYVQPYYYYPPTRMTWWGRPYSLFGRPPYVRRVKGVRQNIPEDTIPLEEGANVIASDEEHVGDLERVFTDPSGERATHLLISEGLFLKEKKVVPTSWIEEVREDRVQLGVDSGLVDSLPEYEEEE